MGFIGINETQLTISSRFHKDNNDYFLHYMLQKVFSINLFDLKTETNNDNIWDFLLIYLFPYYLKKAINQGLYKEYVRNNYNDANLKGAIDINRHLRENLPFKGVIAYSTREHTFDNKLTQLIRHTQEYIKSRNFATVLNNDKETREAVNLINFNTTTYNKQNRLKVIQNNIKYLNHPFYTEYEILRKICLQILRREGLNLEGKSQNKVYGILFDGAWLWEEYLNTLLKDKFNHPENKTGKYKEFLFENSQPIFPDFISKDSTIIVDAKYKHLKYSNDEYGRNDYYQLITYMYRFNSLSGYLIFPIDSKKTFIEKLIIKNTNGVVTKLGLAIPSDGFKDFNSFQNLINLSEIEIMKQFDCL